MAQNPSNVIPDQLIVVEGDAGFVPKSEPSDVGKVLKVDSHGTPVWGEDSGGTSFEPDKGLQLVDGKLSVKVGSGYGITNNMNGEGIVGVVAGDSTLRVTNEGVIVTRPLPASTSSDEGSVLTVNSSGNAAWATPSTVTVDQTYDASSTNAQSGTAVASAISGINQVPASTSADEDKVLTVNSSGTPEWATAQGGGGVTPPTPTTEDYGFTYASIQGFRQGVPTVRTEWAPASFTLFSPFWDSSAGTSRYYTDWWAEFPNHLRGLLGDVGSFAPFWGNMYNQAWSDSGASPWPSVGNRFSADVTLKFPLSVDTSVFTTVLNIDCNITARGADPMGMGNGPEIVLYNAYPRLKLARGKSGYQYFFHQMHIPMCVNNRPISEIGNITYDISVPQGTTMSVPAASQYSQEDLNDFGIYVTFHPETSFQTVYS